MSFNVELPAEKSLKLLAPQKTKESILNPIHQLANGKKEFALEYKKRTGFTQGKGVGKYLPAGQTTQMIVGASPETDGQILRLSQAMYRKFDLKRVYYSSYLPVVADPILPSDTTGLLREHRLYQADWLMRFYGFSSEEISPLNENLPMEYDPKCAWALRNMQFFPVEVNTASVEQLLRVPGIGAKGAYKIISARKSSSLTFEALKKMRIVLKRAKHFITASGKFYGERKEENIKFRLMLAERQETVKQTDFFSLLPTQPQEKEQILLSATQADKEFLLRSTPQIASSVLTGQL
jgi:predicted DNA-binding helix-hairpin-helix protein